METDTLVCLRLVVVVVVVEVVVVVVGIRSARFKRRATSKPHPAPLALRGLEGPL